VAHPREHSSYGYSPLPLYQQRLAIHRGAGDDSPARGLGVSPKTKSPNVWGTNRGFGYCFPLPRGTAGGWHIPDKNSKAPNRDYGKVPSIFKDFRLNR
jgi:hypothetical protein